MIGGLCSFSCIVYFFFSFADVFGVPPLFILYVLGAMLFSIMF